MRIIIQRVSEARVEVDLSLAQAENVEYRMSSDSSQKCVVGEIAHGMMVLVGVESGDCEDDARWLAAKTASLRIFDDADGVMNMPITAVGGRVLAISQFTLTASTRKGNRPSYIRAARGDEARSLYEHYCELLAAELFGNADWQMAVGAENNAVPKPVERGIFGADMAVSLTNSGPVTIIIDSRLRE